VDLVFADRREGGKMNKKDNEGKMGEIAKNYMDQGFN
jgi:hypothetical protein